jgi:ATP-dependent RNA helicase DDX49/DBP8
MTRREATHLSIDARHSMTRQEANAASSHVCEKCIGLLLLFFLGLESWATMAGGKRRELTTDDLLRMQEGPNRKRTRYTSDSEEESDPSGKGPENEDSASSASEGESESEIQSESDEMKKAGHEFYSPKSLNQDTSEGSDREDETHFTSSRISTRPKADQLATISATASTTAVSWISLGIIAPLQTALSSMSIRKPTEIQAACIPPLLAGESPHGLSCMRANSDIL